MSGSVSRENLQEKHLALEESAVNMVNRLQLITNKIYDKFKLCVDRKCGPEIPYQPQNLISETPQKATLFLDKEVYPKFKKRQDCVQGCGTPIQKAGFEIEYQFRAWNMNYNECLGNCKARMQGSVSESAPPKRESPGMIIIRGGSKEASIQEKVKEEAPMEENSVNLECMIGCTSKYHEILQKVEKKLQKELAYYT